MTCLASAIVCACADDGRGAARNVADTARAGVAAAEPASAVAAVDDAAHAASRWYAVDGYASQVHVFDSAGSYLRSFARKGGGPGELLGPQKIAANAGYVYVAEMGRTSISVFDTAGVFVRHLDAPRGCPSANVVAMTAQDNSLYLLRRCMQLPARITLRVEQSAADGDLRVWAEIADTVHLSGNGVIPLHVPLMSVGAGRLVIGEGNASCLRVFGLIDRQPIGERCLHEVPRLPMPADEREDMKRRYRGRIAAPDSLPRATRIEARDDGIALQTIDDPENATWYLVRWQYEPGAKPVALGRARVPPSFLTIDKQLIPWSEEAGVRLEVVRVQR